MRIFIINTDYAPFLRAHYETSPILAVSSYDEQLSRRNASLFGVADFYSRNFRALGHEACEIHANNGAMQTAWMAEHGRKPRQIPRAPDRPLWRFGLRIVERMGLRHAWPESPLRSPFEPANLDLEHILVEQVRTLRPDVILNQSVSEVQGRVLRAMRAHARLVVGQIASPLPEAEDYSVYDLMISSLPNFVRHFRDRGVRAELNRLGFEPSVLDQIEAVERDIPLSFVGSVTPGHRARFDLLERLASETDMAIWGRVQAPETAAIMKRFRGEAWGRDMYRLLARSQITINQHIDISGNFANNMRLYEATGMGALLITDWKDNIADMFVPGKEVVCYRSAGECIELIRHYLSHPAERAVIAAAGQRRTLAQHHYASRVRELVERFDHLLLGPPH